MAPVSFHLISDRVVGSFDNFETLKAHNLIIASNLSALLTCRPEQLRGFLQYCCQNCKHVFVLAGTGEYPTLKRWTNDPLLGSALLTANTDNLLHWDPDNRTQGRLEILHTSFCSPSGYFSFSTEKVVLLGTPPSSSELEYAEQVEHLQATITEIRRLGSFMVGFRIVVVLGRRVGEVMVEKLREAGWGLKGDELVVGGSEVVIGDYLLVE